MRTAFRLFAVALAAFAALSIQQQAAVSAAGSKEAAPQGIYAIWNEGEYDRFTNYAGGYSLRVDKGMSVDMSIEGVCAILENSTKKIEIFSQPLGKDISMASYISYSNTFLKNWMDHEYKYQGYQEVAGRKVHVTQWSRKKLSRVRGDKNFYTCLDVPLSSSEAITIMVSSSVPIDQNGGYLYLLENFQAEKKTQQQYIRKAARVNPDERRWNEETKDFYNRYFGESTELKWGIFEPKAPEYFQEVQTLEKLLDYEFSIVLNYSSFENTVKHTDLEQRLQNAYDAGKTLELTLQSSWTDNNKNNQVYLILDGAYDSFIANYAKTVADFGHPVLFRLGNEMNGDWCPYSGFSLSRDPQLYIELYRYVYAFFEAAGAKNVIWVWNPNSKSFPDFTWNNELMYYPGDQYVDVIGLTAYNTGNYYRSEKWTSFADLYDNFYYGYVEKYDKPMMITEFASATVGGDKIQWVTDMFRHIKYYDMIKVAVWWDGADYDSNGNVARSYYIDDPPALVEVFRKGLRGDYDGPPPSRPAQALPAGPADESWKENVFA